MFYSFKQIGELIGRPKTIPALDEKEKNIIDNYLNTARPNKKALIKDIKLIAVDFETTGLNPVKDEIISMGFCPIVDGIIRLADCVHIIINTHCSLTSDNVAIHGLTDDMLSQGVTQKQALLEFIKLTTNHVIVAHHHSIERTFLQKLAKEVLGKTLPLGFTDTFWFARQQKQRAQQVITAESLRLFNLRKKQGLPNYKAHNALEDAISTAELYLAQMASLGLSKETIRLEDMGIFNYKS